jgi:hypothetical protein
MIVVTASKMSEHVEPPKKIPANAQTGQCQQQFRQSQVRAVI